MVKVSTLAIAGGTLLLAAGAGMYMQMSTPSSDTPQVAALMDAPEQASDLVEPQATIAEKSEEADVELASIALTSSELPAQSSPAIDAIISDAPVVELKSYEDAEPVAPMLVALSDDDVVAEPAPMAEPSAVPAPQDEDPAPEQVLTEADCLVDMIGEARAAAMVLLTLNAPCQPTAKVTFKHEGMTFTGMTDGNGSYEVLVPALSETATFIAMLDDGNGAAVEMDVDTLGFYDRSVVQWQGDSGVELHAFEYGAEWNGEGHVWSGAPRDVSVAARGEGGFMTRLGDADMTDARLAEVYTFPSGTAKIAGEITLSVEVEVTEANCGHDLRADVIQVEGARAGKPGELSLAVPGCDAVGDFIQLKNLVQDLKIASR